MSWFWRGFQSAIFYYLSCAPCTKLNHARKRRTQIRRTRAQEDIDIEAALPDLYRHPLPFSTNPFWREEISMGPGPPPKKGNRDKTKAESSRGLTSGGQASSAGSSSAATTLVVETLEGFDPHPDALPHEPWNTRRYQRPDELLWGIDISHDLAEEDPPTGVSGISTYYTARNPAVNDLHPPVVSTHPTRKSEIRWMLQPPPSALVMEGKLRADTRGRSISGGSHGSSKAMGLARQVGERLMEEKARRGERSLGDLASMSSSSSSPAGLDPAPSISPPGQPHDRSVPPSRNRPLPLSAIPAATTLSGPRPPLAATLSTSSLHVLQELHPPHSSFNARVWGTPREAAIGLPRASEMEELELRVPSVESWFPGGAFRFPGVESRGLEGGRGRGRGKREEDGEDEEEGRVRARWSMDI